MQCNNKSRCGLKEHICRTKNFGSVSRWKASLHIHHRLQTNCRPRRVGGPCVCMVRICLQALACQISTSLKTVLICTLTGPLPIPQMVHERIWRNCEVMLIWKTEVATRRGNRSYCHLDNHKSHRTS
jgi:hypothetical protein